MKDFFNDWLNQLWTLLGMFVAWVVLEGSAKTVVGYCILGSMVLWGITYRLRNPKDKEED
jgi:hypothetical protein